MKNSVLFWTPVFTGVTTYYKTVEKMFPLKVLH